MSGNQETILMQNKATAMTTNHQEVSINIDLFDVMRFKA